MSLHSWLRNLRSALAPAWDHHNQSRQGRQRAATRRPSLEVLEHRLTLSFSPIASYDFGARAVLAADFNNDTVPDLALDTGEVLLGRGDGTFDSPVNSDAAYTPIAVGDLDGDGNLDLVAADAHDVRVLLGHGDGTLAAPSTINVTDPNGGGSLSSVAVGDFNGDGLLDLGATSNVFVLDGYNDYYGWFGHYEGSAHVLLGTGGGAFSGPNTTALGYYGYYSKSAVADFNGDGIDDFATTGGYDVGAVSVLLGDAGGFLQRPTAYFTTFDSASLAVADVDGDLDADLVTGLNSGSGGYGVSVLLGDGAGGFGSVQNYIAGSYSALQFVAVADFNGDGNPDIATTSFKVEVYTATSHIRVLLGHGDGTFSDAISQNLDAGPNASTMVASDFDGDGLPDVAVVRVVNPGADSQVDVLLNAGDWTVPVPSVAINDVTAAEGNTGTQPVTFTVALSGPSSQSVTVSYATADGTATADGDYQAASGTLTFAPNETSQTITVLVNGDRLAEPNETFVVNLSSPTNATIDDGQAVGTIGDDEPRISIGDVTKKEGNGKKTTLFTFTVTLSAAYDQPVTVSFRTADGTAKTSDGDYIAKAGTLTFAPGETTKTITIEVKGDSKREASETFYLDLFDLSSNSLFIKNRGIGTILNDD